MGKWGSLVDNKIMSDFHNLGLTLAFKILRCIRDLCVPMYSFSGFSFLDSCWVVLGILQDVVAIVPRHSLILKFQGFILNLKERNLFSS